MPPHALPISNISNRSIIAVGAILRSPISARLILNDFMESNWQPNPSVHQLGATSGIQNQTSKCINSSDRLEACHWRAGRPPHRRLAGANGFWSFIDSLWSGRGHQSGQGNVSRRVRIDSRSRDFQYTLTTQSHRPCHHGLGLAEGFRPAFLIVMSRSHPVKSVKLCASFARRRSSSSK